MRTKLLIFDFLFAINTQVNSAQLYVDYTSSTTKAFKNSKQQEQNPWPLLQHTINKLNQINDSTSFAAKQLIVMVWVFYLARV